MVFFIKEADSSELSIVWQTMREAFQEYDGKLQPGSGALRETVEDIRAKIIDGGGAVIAWDESVPVGSAQYYFRDHYMYIGRVSVIPAYRGKGIGKEILKYLENKAKGKQYRETRVGVRLSIPENIALYRKLGYEEVEEKHYLEGTDSWYVMRKQLQES